MVLSDSNITTTLLDAQYVSAKLASKLAKKIKAGDICECCFCELLLLNEWIDMLSCYTVEGDTIPGTTVQYCAYFSIQADVITADFVLSDNDINDIVNIPIFVMDNSLPSLYALYDLIINTINAGTATHGYSASYYYGALDTGIESETLIIQICSPNNIADEVLHITSNVTYVDSGTYLYGREGVEATSETNCLTAEQAKLLQQNIEDLIR